VAKLRLRTLRRIVLVIFVLAFALVALRWVSLERWHWEMTHAPEPEKPISGLSPTATPGPTRGPVITGRLDLPRLFNGVTIHSELETTPGAAASEERIDPLSYLLDLKMKAR